jgi:hypothetical protein
MTGKLMFFALGYVLGTRAGREQFRQVARLARVVIGSEEAKMALGLAGRALQVAVDKGTTYVTKRAA